jgi:two-component system sensor histidine kinase DegS
LFRIVQQACQNAVQHARASIIRISGNIEPGHVLLTVQDNGIGFASGEELDLPGLLANRHFGLAGMFERAALIGARLSIRSSTQEGTRVRVVWQAGDQNHPLPA